MNDTSAEMADRFQRMLMRKTPEERLRMACSMFDAAKSIAKISILERFPAISPVEMKRKIFLRFYGEEFSTDHRQRILDAL